MEVTRTYVDGFNLYFGLRQAGFRRYYWLDLSALSKSLLKPDQVFGGCAYFTSRIRNNGFNQPDMDRQSDYIDALSALPDMHIEFGHFLEKTMTCRQCGSSWKTFEEKMTDVNLAAKLLCDAEDGAFDTAIIISGDSDLVTPVRYVRRRHPSKRIVIAEPPRRHSNELRKAANAYFKIGEAKLRAAQLPETIQLPNGHCLQRPASWR